MQGRERQRGQEGSDCILQRHRLTGDGRQSAPARMMKDICPAGRENMIRDHALDCCSRVITSRSLDCTDRDSRWWLQWAACSLIRLLLSSFIRATDCVDEDAGGGLDMMSMLLDGIDSLLVNSESRIRSSISLMLLSQDRWT